MGRIVYEKKELLPQHLEKHVEKRLIGYRIKVNKERFTVQFQSILSHKEQHYFFWDGETKVYITPTKERLPDTTLEYLMYPHRFQLTDANGRPCEPMRYSNEIIEIIEKKRNKVIRAGRAKEEKDRDRRNKSTSRVLAKLMTVKIS